MKNLSTKPISSPSRTDHFPRPLVGFLRTDAASRSRTGRSRSSPIFVRKKTVAIETQDPSSPKVNCMGQVRPRRQAGSRSARCRWVRAVLFLTPRRCRTFWDKWVLFLRRKRESGRKPAKSESGAGDETENSEGGETVKGRVFASSVPSPPKNALILTRCRSAPQWSAFSGYGFWSSPERSGEIGEERRTEHDNGNKPTSETESGNRGSLEKLEQSIGEGNSNSVNCKERVGGPLILRRCKSEPGGVAELSMAVKDSFLPNNGR